MRQRRKKKRGQVRKERRGECMRRRKGEIRKRRGLDKEEEEEKKVWMGKRTGRA